MEGLVQNFVSLVSSSKKHIVIDYILFYSCHKDDGINVNYSFLYGVQLLQYVI